MVILLLGFGGRFEYKLNEETETECVSARKEGGVLEIYLDFEGPENQISPFQVGCDRPKEHLMGFNFMAHTMNISFR